MQTWEASDVPALSCRRSVCVRAGFLRPDMVRIMLAPRMSVNVHRRKDSSVRNALNLERSRNKGEPGRIRTCELPFFEMTAKPCPETCPEFIEGLLMGNGFGLVMFLFAAC